MHTFALVWLENEERRVRSESGARAADLHRTDLVIQQLRAAALRHGQRAGNLLARGEDPAKVRRRLRAELKEAATNARADAYYLENKTAIDSGVRGSARRWMHSHHDREEVSGEAAMKVLMASRERGESFEQPGAFAYVTTRNRAKDHHREYAAQTRIAEAAKAEASCSSPDAGSAFNTFLKTVGAEALFAYIADGRPMSAAARRRRRVVLLRVEGVPNGEIALMLGVSEAQVNTDVSRARGDLERIPLIADLLPPRNPRKGRRRNAEGRADKRSPVA
jgi:RNA polymerase sigma factor (sigma-70 family)